MVPIQGKAYRVDTKKAYNEAIEQLYEPYGGRANLGTEVYNRCLMDQCNSPLNEEAKLGLEPEKRILDPSVRWTILIELNSKKSFSDTPARLFIDRLGTKKNIDKYGIWNYEACWLDLLMKQNPKEVLDAKWDFLSLYVYRGKEMQGFIEDDMPAPDFGDIPAPTLE